MTTYEKPVIIEPQSFAGQFSQGELLFVSERPIRSRSRATHPQRQVGVCSDCISGFHDLCRKAARDLDSAGISQLVGMQVMGRKTESIYKRYRIVDRRDVDRAIDRLVTHKAELMQTEEESNAQFDAQLPAGTA